MGAGEEIGVVERAWSHFLGKIDKIGLLWVESLEVYLLPRLPVIRGS